MSLPRVTGISLSISIEEFASLAQVSGKPPAPPSSSIGSEIGAALGPAIGSEIGAALGPAFGSEIGAALGSEITSEGAKINSSVPGGARGSASALSAANGTTRSTGEGVKISALGAARSGATGTTAGSGLASVCLAERRRARESVSSSESLLLELSYTKAVREKRERRFGPSTEKVLLSRNPRKFGELGLFV
jgi:hypothetical protein